MAKQKQFELVVKPRKGWQAVNLREMWDYRELLLFFVQRDVKIRYRQTVIGIAWAVIQPLAAMLIFTFLFNKVAGIESGTGTPYPLFAYSGLVAWTFFARALSLSSSSLLNSQRLIRKVYFPRLLIPIASIGALLVDLVISLLLIGGLFLWFEWPLSVHLVKLPFFVLLAFMAASGVGCLLSSLSVRYRDIKYVIPFLVQMWLFITPVIYPAKLLERFPFLYDFMGVNPMAGIVNGFRHCLLGDPANWSMIGLSSLMTVVIFVGGVAFFRRWERQFADII